MGVNDGTGQGDLGSDGGFDINQILGTSQGDTAGNQGDASGSAQGSNEVQSAGQKFKFAGRDWDSQEAADKEFRKVWGKYSDQNGLLNKLKSALGKNPNDIAQLAKDPAWAEILSKVGIEAAAQEVEERQSRESAERPQDWEEYRSQFDVERHQFRLEREQWGFEKRLGRDLKPDEVSAVWGIIEKAPSLTFEQAYKLAHHDRLLKEAALKSQTTGGRPKVNRPAPTPSFAAGRKLDLTKPISQMSKEEAREAMRRDIPSLMSESEGKR